MWFFFFFLPSAYICKKNKILIMWSEMCGSGWGFHQQVTYKCYSSMIFTHVFLSGSLDSISSSRCVICTSHSEIYISGCELMTKKQRKKKNSDSHIYFWKFFVYTSTYLQKNKIHQTSKNQSELPEDFWTKLNPTTEIYTPHFHIMQKKIKIKV